MSDDGLDIPAFCRLSREDRIAAWQLFDELPKSILTRATEDNGPGSVSRRLGFPESPADTAEREEYAAKAETDKVKAEAAATHKQAVRAFSQSRRRKSF